MAENHPPPRPILRRSAQLAIQFFVLAEVRAHEALPQPAVVGDMEVEELVRDDVVLKLLPQLEKRGIERQPARRRVRGPLRRHRSHRNRRHVCTELIGPRENACFERGLVGINHGRSGS